MKLAQKPPPRQWSLGGWLHRVATNLAIDFLRNDSLRKQAETDFVARRETAPEAEWNDIENLVDQAIEALPEDLREMVVAHYLEGQSQQAIARDAGITQQAVSKRIKKGVEKLRDHVERLGVPIGAAALASLLSANLAEAAPASLLSTLMKVALAGSLVPSLGSGAHVAALRGKLMGGLVALAALAALVFFLLNPGTSQETSPPPDGLPVLVAEQEEEESTEGLQPEEPPEPEPTAALASEPPATQKLAPEQSLKPDEEPGPSPAGTLLNALNGEAVPGVAIRFEPKELRQAVIVETNTMPVATGVELKELQLSAHDSATRFERDEEVMAKASRAYGVHIKIQPAPGDAVRVYADDEGHFEVPELEHGDYVAVVEDRYWVSQGNVEVFVENYGDLEVDAGYSFAARNDYGPEGLVVPVVPTSAITGRVYEVQRDLGLEGIRVRANLLTSFARVQVIEAETHTDKMGFFELAGLRPGSYQLIRERVEGYASTDTLSHQLSLSPGEQIDNANFPLSIAGLLTGIVYVGGKPAPNTEIGLQFAQVGEDFITNTTAFGLLVDHPVLTDETGRYTVEGIRDVDGGICATLKGPGGQVHQSDLVHVTLHKDEENEIDLHFAWGNCTVEGRLYTDGDRPIPNAPLVLIHGTKPRDFRDITDEDGRFSFEGLEPGEAAVNIYLPGRYDSVCRTFTLREGEPTELDVYVSLEPVLCAIENVPQIMEHTWMSVYEQGWEPILEGTMLDLHMNNRFHFATFTRLTYEPMLLFGLEPGTYNAIINSNQCSNELMFFLLDEEMEQYDEHALLLVTTITIEEGKQTEPIVFDFNDFSPASEVLR